LNGPASSRRYGPLATVVVGGIVTSTFLRLIVLPTLYQRVESQAGTADAA